MSQFKGKLFVFSAPSGSGKTTIVRHLLKQDNLNLEFSISATSREPRGKEVDGKDYYFMSLHDFKQKFFYLFAGLWHTVFIAESKTQVIRNSKLAVANDKKKVSCLNRCATQSLCDEIG